MHLINKIIIGLFAALLAAAPLSAAARGFSTHSYSSHAPSVRSSLPALPRSAPSSRSFGTQSYTKKRDFSTDSYRQKAPSANTNSSFQGNYAGSAAGAAASAGGSNIWKYVGAGALGYFLGSHSSGAYADGGMGGYTGGSGFSIFGWLVTILIIGGIVWGISKFLNK